MHKEACGFEMRSKIDAGSSSTAVEVEEATSCAGVDGVERYLPPTRPGSLASKAEFFLICLSRPAPWHRRLAGAQPGTKPRTRAKHWMFTS